MSKPIAPSNIPAGAWLYVGVVTSLALRLTLFDFESGDFRAFLGPWYDFIASHRGIHALKHDFFQYSVLYLYFILVATWLPLSKLYAIKLISILFDYAAAYFVFKIVSVRHGRGARALAAAIITLFMPTVWLNSALWGNCDAMYSTCLLACLYWVLKEKPVAALVAFGAACAFKPQGIFFVPLLGGLILKGRISWRLLWIPPGIYLLLGVPALLLGHPVGRTYLNELRLYSRPMLTLGATNWYQWLSNDEYSLFLNGGWVLTIAACLFLALSVQCWSEGVRRRELLVCSTMLSALVVPYFMPGMHERYFFAADLLSVVYAFCISRGFIVTVLVQCASFFTYLPYLFEIEPIPRSYLAVVMTAALGLVVADYVKLIRSRELDEEESALPVLAAHESEKAVRPVENFDVE